MRSKINILFKSLYVEQILVSIVFHTVEHSVEQMFKCELKRFLLSVELNHLGIL